MNTLTLNSRRRVFKVVGHSIGANTENVTSNFPNDAVRVAEPFWKSNRSDFIRRAVAEKIQRINVWSGLAFRATCRLSNEVATGIRSIFSPGSPSAIGEAFKAATEAQKIERTQAKSNADALIEDLTKTMPSGEFVPTK